MVLSSIECDSSPVIEQNEPNEDQIPFFTYGIWGAFITTQSKQTGSANSTHKKRTKWIQTFLYNEHEGSDFDNNHFKASE